MTTQPRLRAPDPTTDTRERQTTTLLVIGTALLPLQIWPAMPLAGMQLSDLVFALAFARFLWPVPEAPAAVAAVPMAAFAAGAAVSACLGGSMVKLLGHFELAAIGWMAACALPHAARRLRQALVIAAALAALTALAGLAVFFSGNAGYDAFGRPDNPLLYLHGALVTDDYPRAKGTLVTGAMLTSVVASGVALLWFERDLVPARWSRRLIFLGCAVALVFAFSRSIATLAVVLLAAGLCRRNRSTLARGAFLVVAVAYAAALWVSLRYHVVLDPLAPWTADVLGADGDRFGRWRLAVAAIAESPLVGAGPGSLVAAGWSAHNTWLNLWAVLGIVPLAAFAVLLLASIRSAVRSGAAGLASALIFALIESSYNDIEDMRHVWLLIGLALGIMADAPGRRAPQPLGPPNRTMRSISSREIPMSFRWWSLSWCSASIARPLT